MNFERWQIEKIRGRLNAYRQHAGVNGHARPWKSLLWDILAHDETVNELNEDGSPPHFKQEALRRFGNGESNLDYDKLNDVYIFLLNKKYLTAKELDEDPYNIHEALTLHGYLASGSDEARFCMVKFSGTYEVERQENGNVERLSLTMHSNVLQGFFQVEKIRKLFCEPGTEPGLFEAKDKGKKLNIKKTGFGFICTRKNLLHMFLHGPERDDLSTYIQFSPISDPDQIAILPLIRIGEDLMLFGHSQEEAEASSVGPHVIEFKNARYRDLMRERMENFADHNRVVGARMETT